MLASSSNVPVDFMIACLLQRLKNHIDCFQMCALAQRIKKEITTGLCEFVLPFVNQIIFPFFVDTNAINKGALNTHNEVDIV